MYPYIHCSIIHGGQDMETTKIPFERGLDKEDVVHTYCGLLLSYKKGCHLRQHGWNLRINILSKLSQSEEANSHVISLMWNIKPKLNRHRQQYGGYQREAGGVGWIVKGKGGQIYGDRRWFDFGEWAHNAVYRSCITEMYTWNLCDLTN